MTADLLVSFQIIGTLTYKKKNSNIMYFWDSRVRSTVDVHDAFAIPATIIFTFQTIELDKLRKNRIPVR